MPKRPRAIDLWDDPVYSDIKDDNSQDDSVALPVVDENHAQPRVGRGSEDSESEATSDSDNEEDLNETCVTPLIALISRRFFRDLRVIGPRSDTPNADSITKELLLESDEYNNFTSWLLDIVHGPASRVTFQIQDLLKFRSVWYSKVIINSVPVKINDIVMVPAGSGNRPEFPLPEDGRQHRKYSPIFAGDYFWFARVLGLRDDTRMAHVQWFHHGCKTVLEELAHPQELFLSDLCNDIKVATILAVCQVSKVRAGERPVSIKHDEFFYSFYYSAEDASFRDIRPLEDNPLSESLHPGHCGLCARRDQEEERTSDEYDEIRSRDGTIMGLIKHGTPYHVGDAILIKRTEAADIGLIVSFSRDLSVIVVRLFGRMNDVTKREADRKASIHEDRHLFLTDEELQLQTTDLVDKCFVRHESTLEKGLAAWLRAKPLHFYVAHQAPLRKTASKSNIVPLPPNDYPSCHRCQEKEIKETAEFQAWRRKQKDKPLRAFDPFAGVGAFALSMCRVSNMRLTHAVEIDPSAANTLKENNPGTIVYNECSNKFLEYSILRESKQGKAVTANARPPPPHRGEIDCIVSGFPCQPHSSLNMFQKARDLRNELFLNTISWVDHLRPKYVLFENVEGFVSYRINAVQISRHTVKGGIEQGGLKFLLRALITMGYQVRFGLLQAGHYGTPQSRVRFFLWAAQHGLTLPEFPTPTHDFPRTIKMQIKIGPHTVAPIKSDRGSRPQCFITVKDAILDLKPWEWQDPQKRYKKARRSSSTQKNITQVVAHVKGSECGPEDEDTYDHVPNCYFQARCRQKPSRNLQHTTPCFKPEIVEAVVNIALEKGANYESLNEMPLLWEYQTMAATSANGRRGYKTPSYARLDDEGYFNTIVTNVGATAKQSKVLHPLYKRIITVRELARAQGFPDDFVFKAIDGKIRTMHRQIGNAVPWPVGEALAKELEKACWLDRQ